MPLPSNSAIKRRRLPGACDNCKYRKIRCDSAEKLNGRCTNCTNYNEECTHSTTRKRATAPHPYPSIPILPLDNKTSFNPPLSGNLEVSGGAIHPLILTMLSSLSMPDRDTQNALMALSQHIINLENEISNLKSKHLSPESHTTELVKSHEHLTNSPSDTNDEVDLPNMLKGLTISTSQARHFGPSSTMSLLGIALQFRREKSRTPISDRHFGSHRPQFWTIHSWELLPEDPPVRHEFPDEEVLYELIPLYFENVNPHMPLLHRPTFERAVKEGLHLANSQFGATVLGVCAVASRYSNNPCVLIEGGSRLSAGWKWFRQIRQCWQFSSRTPLLWDIQTICLALLYTHGTSQPEATWIMLGMGIRFAQDIGAHRKKPNQKPSIEGELWKRCFWILVCVDALVCSFLGRPRATVSDDFDLDLPVDCDDEYWELMESEVKFTQPPGQPSKLSSFIAYIRLMEILEYAQRTLYAVDKSKRSRGPGPSPSDKDIVAGLDSELNQWFDNLPEHLKRTSCSPGTIFYEQSAMLHACYYHVRILVHRPFIPLPSNPSRPSPSPSLEICVNAARSCTRILKAQSEQLAYLPFPQIQFAIFTSAILLLVNHWKNSKSTNDANSPDVREDLRGVEDCISVLSKLEQRWTPAGRFCDVLREISSFGGMPVTATSHIIPSQENFATYTQSSNMPGGADSLQFPWDTTSLSQFRAWEDVQNQWTFSNVASGWNIGSLGSAQNLPTYSSQLHGPGSVDRFASYATEGLQQIMMPPGEVDMDFGDLTILQWLQQSQMKDNGWTMEPADVGVM